MRLNIKNPVSGETKKVSIEVLLERSIDDTVSLWKTLERLLSGMITDPLEAVGDKPGRSLNVGLTTTPTSECQYFSSEGLPIPELEIKN